MQISEETIIFCEARYIDPHYLELFIFDCIIDFIRHRLRLP